MLQETNHAEGQGFPLQQSLYISTCNCQILILIYTDCKAGIITVDVQEIFIGKLNTVACPYQDAQWQLDSCENKHCYHPKKFLLPKCSSVPGAKFC